MSFVAAYCNVNGPMVTVALSARTLLGAKREAYQRATGEHTSVTILEDGEDVAQRESVDSFWGFCRGAKPWSAPQC